MKNRKKFEAVTIVFLFIATSLLCINGLSAQSLKKTFKYIREGDIANADLEINQFTDKIKKSSEDYTLYGLASCLIVCNEKCTNYDPYKALEMYSLTIEINADKAEVDKFLGKYEFTIDKVHEIIFQSIFIQAQKINTEASYQKALSICHACTYKDEAIKLKETAAYNEAKSIRSVDGYKYFIGSYSKSEHLAEIKNLLYGLAFQNAKSKMSLLSMNNYLKEYSNSENKFETEATHLRDSIAFSKVNKSYDAYVEFEKKYPKSELIPSIKEQLPALLFYKAQQENDLSLFEFFISQYPEESKLTSAKVELEKLYYEKLLSNISKIGLDDFNKRFPNSRFIDSLNVLITKIIANSDVKKDGLNGKVKAITKKEKNLNPIISKDFDFYVNSIDNYDEFGRKIIHYSPSRGGKDSIIYGINGKVSVAFYDLGLTSGTFPPEKINNIYDKSGNLIERDLTDFFNLKAYDIDTFPEIDKKVNQISDAHYQIKDFYYYDDKGNRIRSEIFAKFFYYDKLGILKELSSDEVQTSIPYPYIGYVKHLINNYIYNSIGALTEQSENANGTVTRFKYDKKLNLLEENTFLANGKPEHTFQYNLKGEIISMHGYSSNSEFDNLQEKLNHGYKYDENSNLVEENSFFSNGNIKQTIKYNSKGNIILNIEYSSYNNKLVRSKKVFKYDNKGNETERISEDYNDMSGKYIATSLFTSINEYDSKGNLIRKTSLIDNKPLKLYESTIEYY